jgi:hypothetical protein
VLGAALTWANLYATDFLAYMPSSAQVPNFTALPGEVRQRLLGSFGSYLDALLPTTKSALEPLLPVLAAFMNNGGPCCIHHLLHLFSPMQWCFGGQGSAT